MRRFCWYFYHWKRYLLRRVTAISLQQKKIRSQCSITGTNGRSLQQCLQRNVQRQTWKAFFIGKLAGGIRCSWGSLCGPFDPPTPPCPKGQKAPAGRFFCSKYNWSTQKPPAGRFSGSKCNLINPIGPCGTIFCYSQSGIYDIGIEILLLQ